MSDHYRIPLHDMRAVHRVWGRKFHKSKRVTEHSLHTLLEWMRVYYLDEDPHAECDHARCICYSRRYDNETIQEGC